MCYNFNDYRLFEAYYWTGLAITNTFSTYLHRTFHADYLLLGIFQF